MLTVDGKTSFDMVYDNMDMILFEVFLKSIDLIPQHYNGTISSIGNVIVLSDLVESSGYSSKDASKRIMSICAYGRGFTVYKFKGEVQ